MNTPAARSVSFADADAPPAPAADSPAVRSSSAGLSVWQHGRRCAHRHAQRESIYKVSKKVARLIHLESPWLNGNEMDRIASLAKEENGGFQQASISTRYALEDGPDGIKAAIDAICDKAVEEVRNGGVEVLILSDMAAEQAELDVSTYIYIPPLVAVGAVHHCLIKEGLRMDTMPCIPTSPSRP